MPIAIRKPYDEHPRVKQHVGEVSLVQAHMQDECDINNIMKKYEQTGSFTHINRFMAQYGDISDVADYKTSLERMAAAEEMFMTIPASIRAKFDNDPGNFVEYASDPNNLDEMRKLGLAEPEKPSGVERSSLGTKEGVAPLKGAKEKSPKDNSNPKNEDLKGDQ